jgi:hypothetical protein
MRALCGHNHGHDSSPGLPTTSYQDESRPDQGRQADRSHNVGSPPRSRHRDPPVHTAVGHVTNPQPPIRGPGWDRGTGRLDEVHVRRGPY